MTKTQFLERLHTEADCCRGIRVAWIWNNRNGHTEDHLFFATFPLSYDLDRVKRESWKIWQEEHRGYLR